MLHPDFLTILTMATKTNEHALSDDVFNPSLICHNCRNLTLEFPFKGSDVRAGDPQD